MQERHIKMEYIADTFNQQKEEKYRVYLNSWSLGPIEFLNNGQIIYKDTPEAIASNYHYNITEAKNTFQNQQPSKIDPYPDSMDAREWADKFNNELECMGLPTIEHGFLVGWFAEAILTANEESYDDVYETGYKAGFESAYNALEVVPFVQGSRYGELSPSNV